MFYFRSKVPFNILRNQENLNVQAIPSFSQSLDKVLGLYGLQLPSITELLGLPGSGKTQVCLQLCASVQIPRPLGGLYAEALYIDTNTNFTVERFQDILTATVKRCELLLGIKDQTPLNLEAAMRKLHYVQAYGLVKFCAFLKTLPRFIAEHSNVKLIVIDSITFPFKDEISPQKRTGLLFRLMADLRRLVHGKMIAVLITNEMSTRRGLITDGCIVGSLGDAWAHLCNNRVLLVSDNKPGDVTDNRLALLMKSNIDDSVAGRFQITEDGIRDV